MAVLPYQQYAKYTLKSKHPVLFNDSDSGKTLDRAVNGHIRTFNISYPKLTQTEFAELDGFLANASTFGSFTITLPDREPLGVATGTPLVNGALAKDVSSIITDGWTVSQTGIMKAGDLIQFGHTHVYTVVSDADSDSGGNATLLISPPLKQAIANNEAITVTSIPFTVRCTKKHQSRVSPPILYDFNFDAQEVA